MDEQRNTEKSGKHYQFYQQAIKQNADATKTLMQRLNKAAEAGKCQVCMWILSKRFPEEFDRRIYQKMNVVSKNQN